MPQALRNWPEFCCLIFGVKHNQECSLKFAQPNPLTKLHIDLHLFYETYLSASLRTASSLLGDSKLPLYDIGKLYSYF